MACRIFGLASTLTVLLGCSANYDDDGSSGGATGGVGSGGGATGGGVGVATGGWGSGSEPDTGCPNTQPYDSACSGDLVCLFETGNCDPPAFVTYRCQNGNWHVERPESCPGLHNVCDLEGTWTLSSVNPDPGSADVAELYRITALESGVFDVEPVGGGTFHGWYITASDSGCSLAATVDYTYGVASCDYAPPGSTCFCPKGQSVSISLELESEGRAVGTTTTYEEYGDCAGGDVVDEEEVWLSRVE